jgi:UDP:flavonoid glycosyltransferase YjiC (YdhE family)
MARILFIVYPEQGHVRPAVTLAKALTARGHAVSFLTLPDAAAWVRSAGFDCGVMGSDFFPPGTLVRAFPGIRQLEALRRHAKAVVGFAEAAACGAMDADIVRAGASVCLVDGTWAVFALGASRLGLKAATYSVVCPPAANRGFARTPKSPPRLRRAFESVVGAAWVAVRGWLLQRLRVPLPRLEQLMVRAAEAAGYPVDGIDLDHALPHALIGLPEFILAPRALDHESHERINRHYLGLCVDAGQGDSGAAPPPVHANGASKHVYVSLGSHARDYKWRDKVYEAVVRASAELTGWRFTLALGDSAAAVPSGSGVISVGGWMDQRAILAEASVFVTHGGLGSIKEAIVAQIPMIVVPMSFDQFDNADRVCALQVGTQLSAPRLKGRTLARRIVQVFEDTVYRTGLQELLAACTPDLAGGCALLERVLSIDPAEPVQRVEGSCAGQQAVGGTERGRLLVIGQEPPESRVVAR